MWSYDFHGAGFLLNPVLMIDQETTLHQMDGQRHQPQQKITARHILTRFGHLLSAQGVEALVSAVFFIYLAWLDAKVYGEVMYALATGALVMKVVQFGLYYPLVSDLGRAAPEKQHQLIHRVNLIKTGLMILSLAAVWAVTRLRGFSDSMTWVVMLVCLGCALEALAETFFAFLRVQGRQKKEARIKIAGSILSYGYGFSAAFWGWGAAAMGGFRLISGVIRLWSGAKESPGGVSLNPVKRSDWPAVGLTIRTAAIFALIEILSSLYNKTNIFFMESLLGVKAVAYYSATWNLVEAVAILASEQFLGWVIFPLLALQWWRHREESRELVRVNARWLIVAALPIMFFLSVQSEFLIGLIYPEEYKPAVWMQTWLVWAVIIAFEHNLFAYVMMVSGGQKPLLIFTALTLVFNLLFNLTLIEPLGLLGGCLVIILTKMFMGALTFGYCQIYFKFLKWRDLILPAGLGAVMIVVYRVTLPLLSSWPATLLALTAYGLGVWKLAVTRLGRP
ncbi:MAG: oligosaccharide flippase family protein [Thermodesulfobacteriota bacterium]